MILGCGREPELSEDVRNVLLDRPLGDDQSLELRLRERLIGHTDYHRRNNRIAFTHTEVDEPYEGRGFGGLFAEAALNMAEEEGLKVVPLCPFIAHYIDENPRYARLVAADHHDRWIQTSR